MLTSTYHDNYLDLLEISIPPWERLRDILGNHLRSLEFNYENLLTGTVVVIDPGSSRTGYAIYRNGKLKDCGTIVTQGRYIWQRLRSLHDSLRSLPGKIDVLVIENIGLPNDKTIMPSYVKLMQGIGVALSRLQYRYMVLCPVDLWRACLTDETPEKIDDRDAVIMGQVIMHCARHLRDAAKAEAKLEKEAEVVPDPPVEDLPHA